MSRDPKIFRNQVVRISDLATTNDVIEGTDFEGCHILGPAVLLPLEECEFRSSAFEGQPLALLWPLGEDRDLIIGAIGLRRCTFHECRFTKIGLAGREDLIEKLRKDLVRGDDP